MQEEFSEIFTKMDKICDKVELQKEVNYMNSYESTPVRMTSRSVVDSNECKLVYDKEGRVLLLIRPEQGNDLIVEFKNNEDMRKNVEKILLNIEKAKIEGRPTITSNSDRIVELSSRGNYLGNNVYKRLEDPISKICEISGIENNNSILQNFLNNIDYFNAKENFSLIFNKLREREKY